MANFSTSLKAGCPVVADLASTARLVRQGRLRLLAVTTRILADSEVAERILAIGPIAETGVSPEQFCAFLWEENQRWGGVAKEIGLLPE